MGCSRRSSDPALPQSRGSSRTWSRVGFRISGLAPAGRARSRSARGRPRSPVPAGLRATGQSSGQSEDRASRLGGRQARAAGPVGRRRRVNPLCWMLPKRRESVIAARRSADASPSRVRSSGLGGYGSPWAAAIEGLRAPDSGSASQRITTSVHRPFVASGKSRCSMGAPRWRGPTPADRRRRTRRRSCEVLVDGKASKSMRRTRKWASDFSRNRATEHRPRIDQNGSDRAASCVGSVPGARRS